VNVKIIKSLWGMTQGPALDDKLRAIRQAGYDGVGGDLWEVCLWTAERIRRRWIG
jgi:hypothetical protein